MEFNFLSFAANVATEVISGVEYVIARDDSRYMPVVDGILIPVHDDEDGSED